GYSSAGYEAPTARSPRAFPTRRSSDLTQNGHQQLDRATDRGDLDEGDAQQPEVRSGPGRVGAAAQGGIHEPAGIRGNAQGHAGEDRKSTRLNSSHVKSSYAVFCLKKTT